MLAISTDGNLLASICRPDWQNEEWEERHEREWEWGADYPHSQHPSSLLEIWDLNLHETISSLGLDFIVRALGFLRDGKRLALAGNQNRFEIWNAQTGSRLQTLQRPDEPDVCFTCLAVPDSTYLNQNGDLIASGSDNGAVRLWDSATGDCIGSIRTPGERVGALTFSHNGRILAVGLGNGTVEVRDFRSGTLVWELKGHDGSIVSMAFLGDDQLASTSRRKGIRIWDLKTGGCVRTIYMRTAVMVVSLGSGGHFASTASDEPEVRIWNNKGDSIQLFEGNGEGSNVLAFCPEQQLLAHATFYGVDIWDLKLFPFIEHIPLHIEQVLSTTLSSDSLLLASGSEDSIKIWNTTNGTCIRSIDCDLVGGELAFSPNSRYLVSRCRTSEWPKVLTELTIWNADDGQAVKTFPNVRGWEVFPPDGRLLALALSSIVTVWDMDASKQRHQIQCSATCLVFSADGNKLALASDTKLEIWDMSNGKRIWTVGHQRTRVRSITLSADTRLLAAASQRGIDVWDVSARELRVSIFAGQSLHHTVCAVAFSPNRELLAWISDGDIGMRNLKDGRETHFSVDGVKRRFLSYEWLSSDPGLSGRATIQFKGPDCSRLCTSIGDLDINADGAITGFHGYHLDEDHEWIMKGEERMVLLPEEYRGGPASILSGQRIAVSGWNGGILFFQLV
jgi:WD40 repeat protein